MTILLLGSGGREHAIAWKLRQSPTVTRLICAPGNPGMASLGELAPVAPEDADAVVELWRHHNADLVVIGPEAPLAAGVSDALRQAGAVVFGPSQAAARLEWDKSFSKGFMQRHGIPSAASQTFTAQQLDAAHKYVNAHPLPVVLKASGLAAGKGVVIAETTHEALAALDQMLDGSAFGEAGETVVIEEFMQGEEASVFAITDGKNYGVLAPSQDHKRVGDGDTGPNTGGMGAYAPAPIVTPELMESICQQIIEPTLRGMAAEGTPYVGCLYVGVMIHNGAARVVEFNSRFGDPETQVILPILTNDLATVMLAAATGTMDQIGQLTSNGAAACVVMASEGYPASYPKGREIVGIGAAESEEGGIVFHAGTAMRGAALVTNGGRVLGVASVNQQGDLLKAIRQAYYAVERISFDGAFYRSDIGHRAAGRAGNR
ncbi:MAG: phosphoribosylamine--glycine ligase [Chlorobi bacterium]|nr:phosphoribosylamine--glycine ligase [Chlorobiota bacterium]MBX7215469.1 phosphoribosylamine--glycine ligase [Candidatus Kapabacteria bacterium]